MAVTLKVNREVVAEGRVPITVPGWFTGNDCLDLGNDLGSPVSNDYYDLAPFKFNGTVSTTKMEHLVKSESDPENKTHSARIRVLLHFRDLRRGAG